MNIHSHTTEISIAKGSGACQEENELNYLQKEENLFSKLSSTHFILTIEITLTKLQIEVT